MRKKLKSSRKKTWIVLFVVSALLVSVTFLVIFFKNTKSEFENLIPIDLSSKKGLERKPIGGEIITKSDKKTFEIAYIDRSNRATLPASQIIAPLYSVDHYLVKFRSYDKKYKPIEITAQYFIPRASTDKDLPMYVFGSGTTGIHNACAPSKEQPTVDNWGNYQAHMLSYASQGYAVVFPDYEGFNDPERIHHYFNAELEARVLLDAARSLKKFSKQEDIGVVLSEKIILAGFSQGGHAAIAAKEFAPDYAPELNIVATVSYAPALNVEALLREAPALSPYLFTSYASTYGSNIVNLPRMLQPQWVNNIQKNINLCVNGAYSLYGHDPKRIYTPEFYSILFSGEVGKYYPDFKKALEKNYVGTRSSEIPNLILQGSTDPIVTAKTVKAAAKRMCNSGNLVTYKEYPNINHFMIRQVSFRDTLDWMRKVLDGSRAIDSNCDIL